MRVIKTIPEKQDIYIIGACYTDIAPDVKITDDFTAFRMVSGTKKVHVETAGFVHIFTKTELLTNKERLDRGIHERNSEEGIVLKNFMGNIRLRVMTESGLDRSSEIDLAEYVSYQVAEIVDEDDGELYDDYIEWVEISVDHGYELVVQSVYEIYKEVL